MWRGTPGWSQYPTRPARSHLWMETIIQCIGDFLIWCRCPETIRRILCSWLECCWSHSRTFGYDERFSSRRIFGGSSCGSRNSRNSWFFDGRASWTSRIKGFFAFERRGSWSSWINGIFAFWRHDKGRRENMGRGRKDEKKKTRGDRSSCHWNIHTNYASEILPPTTSAFTQFL